MRRGFKTEAERLAAQVREELGLSPTDPLDPWRLADVLAIPVMTLREYGQRSGARAVQLFLTSERDSFSAITLCQGYRRVIVYNESNAPTRQRSDLAHEFAHTLLEHAPRQVLDGNGCRYIDDEIEEEATWLAGALLVPRDGALRLAVGGRSPADVAGHYGVSEDLSQWRLNSTGVTLQLARRARFRRGQSGT